MEQAYGGFPPPAQTVAKKYAPKRHSAAQEAALAAMKPGAQQPQPERRRLLVGPGGGGSGGGVLGFLRKGPLSSWAGSLHTTLHGYAQMLFPSTSMQTATVTTDASNRFNSFAPMRTSIKHNPKWYVDGKDYMYAVSCALENAQHSIWIMDWWLSPELHLRRPESKWTFPGDPPGGRYRLDNMLAAAAARGVEVKIIVYKEVEMFLTLNSHYTKTALEARHANIAVMRHPDHAPDATNTLGDFYQQLKDGYDVGDLSRAVFGIQNDQVLYWAHHEKMVLVDAGWGDQEKGFMGGLDLCFGRWDTNEHPIADVHPRIDGKIFLGQDYNNGRVMDFHNVDNWTQNNLDRTKFSRMGWTDVALSMQGPILGDLASHFTQRWNYIYEEKYTIRVTGEGARYKPLPATSSPSITQKVKDKVTVGLGGYFGSGSAGDVKGGPAAPTPQSEPTDTRGLVASQEGLEGVRCQLLRSACPWSHPITSTEHSIYNAYVETIRAAEHFVYIENQFFITATTESKQKPIVNLIGAAIVERILRAYTSQQPFKIIIVIPAVPGFAGDIHDDASLGTRAIMEFQYKSIRSDKGYSILEQLEKGGIPKDLIKNYIRFYNLRNYDRIYDAASQGPPAQGGEPNDRCASVARCVMLGGGDIRDVPWTGPPQKEVDAFVSEELYIHSKLLIADDRRVICGSANLNDRSQVGNHDSEIAVIIEDPTPLPSTMAGNPYIASHFAGTLRRQIFRKHLGLIPAQDLSLLQDDNLFPSPVPNVYDFDSEEDRLVADPLGTEFTKTWDEIARTNTECFRKVFRPVPDDGILNWKQYEEWFSSVFKPRKANKATATSKVYVADIGAQEVQIEQPSVDNRKMKETPKPETEWGHVVRRNFNSDPVVAAKEVKQVLAHVRGHLVECPIKFLEGEADIAKEGVKLNAFTEIIYT